MTFLVHLLLALYGQEYCTEVIIYTYLLKVPASSLGRGTG